MKILDIRQFNRNCNLTFLKTLIVVISIMMSLPFTKAFAQEPNTKPDTIKQVNDMNQGPLYDHILSDPRNREYLKMSKQGWLMGPGSKTYLRFGGFIQANFIRDFQNTGYNYGEFITAGIPVPTDESKNTEFDIRTSRLTFETQSDTRKGTVSTFFSMDLSGMTQEGSVQPRLRQAYVSWIGSNKRQSVVIGQASTTFMDGYAWPDVFDLEGPNAYLLIRQVMVRYSFMLSKQDHWIGAVALEQPVSDVQNGNGLKGLPDVIFTANYKKKFGHLKFGVIGRQLMAESTGGGGKASTFGWGLLFSGQIMVPYKQDNFVFQLVGGAGTGRYIEDLGSAEDGQGAVYDDSNETLSSLGTYAFLAGYQHWWLDNLRTTVTGGYVNIDNQSIQGNNEFHSSTYFAANLIFTPFKKFDAGLEYYYGQRVNNDGNKGSANRLMLTAKYQF